MEDRAIIDLYWSRDPEAIRRTGEKYGNYCRAVARRILPDRRDAEDAGPPGEVDRKHRRKAYIPRNNIPLAPRTDSGAQQCQRRTAKNQIDHGE